MCCGEQKNKLREVNATIAVKIIGGTSIESLYIYLDSVKAFLSVWAQSQEMTYHMYLLTSPPFWAHKTYHLFLLEFFSSWDQSHEKAHHQLLLEFFLIFLGSVT